MNISCYIIDDEYHAIEVLSDYIEKTPGVHLAGSSTDPLLGLEEINDLRPAVLFLDLHMPGLTGIELARILQGSTNIVFSSSLREFGPEAYQLGVSYYLLKPIAYEQFLICIQKIKNAFAIPNGPAAGEPFYFFVKSDIKGKLIRISAADILYISSEQNYLHIHLSTEIIKAYLTITELLEQLPAGQFSRPHRAYIVNISHIKNVEHGFIRLSNNVMIDIGPIYREEFLQRLHTKLIVSHRGRKP